MELNYLLFGNGPSRKELDLNSFRNSINASLAIGCNAIWKDLPNIDYIVCYDDEPVKQMVKENYIKGQYEFEKLIIPNKFEKNLLERANSGYYALKFFSEKMSTRTSYNDKNFHMVGVDSFLENSTGNCYSYSQTGFIHHTSNDQSKNLIRSMVNIFDKHLDIMYHIYTNGMKMREIELPRNVIVATEPFKANLLKNFVIPVPGINNISTDLTYVPVNHGLKKGTELKLALAN